MENKDYSNKETTKYSEDLIIRQHAWLKEKLRDSESVREFSYRKSALLAGISFIFIGVVTLLDMCTNFFSRSIFILLASLGASLILLYIGFWLVQCTKKEYVFVTTQRLVYQKVNILGRYGREISIPLSDISKARLYKSTVMFRAKSISGDIVLTLKNGKKQLISNLNAGEHILEAIKKN